VLPALAFLNLGPSEVALILVVLVVLFGADKLPELARRVGQAKAKLDAAKSQVVRAFEDEEQRASAEQADFERKREAYIRAMGDPPREDLVKRAEALGLQTQGLDAQDLKAALAARLAGEDATEPAVEKKEPENAAGAQQ
jgi:sec-independent protein translocase protein TatA